MGVSKSFGITKSNSYTLLGSKPISNLQETLLESLVGSTTVTIWEALYFGDLNGNPYVAIHTGSCIRAVTISTRGN